MVEDFFRRRSTIRPLFKFNAVTMNIKIEPHPGFRRNFSV